MSDAISWVQRAGAEESPTNLAIATTGEAMGSIGLTLETDVHRRSAEIGYEHRSRLPEEGVGVGDDDSVDLDEHQWRG